MFKFSARTNALHYITYNVSVQQKQKTRVNATSAILY